MSDATTGGAGQGGASEAPEAVNARLAALETHIAELSARVGRLELGRPVSPPPRFGPQVAQPVVTASVQNVPPVRAQARPPAATRPVTPSGSASLERLVGGKLYLVLGGLVVVIGVGLFLKLAVERGWFTFSPGLRCLSAAGLGFALVVAGDLARKRLSALVGAGLAATGIAVLMAAALASNALYGLTSPPVALGLVVLASVLGLVTALRNGSAALGVLSLLGAYVGLFPVYGFGDLPSLTPWYLLALLGMSLGLAWVRPVPFRRLRVASWWGTSLVGIVWWLGSGSESAALTLVFVTLVWCMVHAEMVLGSRRAPERPRFMRTWDVGLSTVATTAWTVALETLAMRSSPALADLDWLPALGVSAACGVLGIMLAGGLRAFVDPPKTDVERLGAAALVQSGGLLLVAIALGLSGGVIAAAWLALGLTAAACGRWLKSPSLFSYAWVVLLASVGRLVFWDGWLAPRPTTIVLGLGVHLWTALMLMAAGMCFVAAWLRMGVERGRAVRVQAIIATAFGLGCVCLSIVSRASSGSSVVMTWMLVALACVLLQSVIRRVALDVLGLGVVALATIHGVGVFGFQHDWNRWTEPALLHPGLIAGLIGCAAIMLAWRLSRGGRATGAWVALVTPLPALLLMLAVTSLEVARVASKLTGDATGQAAAVSIWWGVVALVLIVSGFALRRAMVRHAGLALLGLAAVKVLLVDLGEVGPEWRVGSFLVVGLAMLGVSVVYARMNSLFQETAREAPASNSVSGGLSATGVPSNTPSGGPN